MLQIRQKQPAPPKRGLFFATQPALAAMLQTSRQEFPVKTFGKGSSIRRTTAGGQQASIRERQDRSSRFVALVCVAGVSRYACEAKYP
jgi:hypothetical protein